MNKQETTKRVKELRRRYRAEQPIGGNDWWFLCELFQRHHYYDRLIGDSPIAMIFLFGGVSGRAFEVVTKDGERHVIDYTKCISPTIAINDFRRAARRAVEPQLREFIEMIFRSPGEKLCPVSGKPLEVWNATADYVPPLTFNRLIDAFIEQHSLDVDGLLLETQQSLQTGNQLGNIDKAWQLWHSKNAILYYVADGRKFPSRPARDLPGMTHADAFERFHFVPELDREMARALAI